MDILPCLYEKNESADTGRYETEKLPSLLPKVQKRNADCSGKLKNNRHQRA